jgi:hypothetical protein
MAQLMFKGLKVLDCSSFIAAPAAATILSDFGADVIKIEPPGAGDPYRAVPSLPTMPQAKENYAWMLASRNKRTGSQPRKALGAGSRATPGRPSRRFHNQLSGRGPQEAWFEI